MSKDNFSYEKEDLENEFEDEFEDESDDEFDDELAPPPEDETCEYCDAPATTWVQDNPACDDCFTTAYEKLIRD
ncbi:hypothetical protein [Haemophilus haemolyticus]|mgnify:CR=1 FL=1|uniref:hypothetical protein n=1 Tax=Haemophilus haemolyticus TaxID=726 RepID=UPI00186451E5|nr:hypothetical protein [Haemophilus haemolyticus]